MTITRDAPVAAIDRVAGAMERDLEELNSVDGALGDGDLGITMRRGMRAIVEHKDSLPEDLGMMLFHCAQAFTKSSGSSYGTLLATGLMSAAKTLKGQTEIDAADISTPVAQARDKMQQRGKAELGGKTVLDSLDYVARATENASDIASSAAGAVDQALDDFRDKTATIGRARIFGERSIGLNDPGMVAMQRVVRAAVGQ